MIETFQFSSDEYQRLARLYRHEFESMDPFHHVVIDDFLPAWTLEKVLEEFPDSGDVPWKRFRQSTSVKLASEGDTFFSPFTRHLLQEFNSQTFLQFLETLTGIEGLIPDPYFEGGGLHQIERGGFLKVHADFNYHEKLRLDRRLNVLVYLNKDWDESFGGALELWDSQMRGVRKKIPPIFNRCVIFATTDQSFHGHPDPLECPEGRVRRSIALYYYTNGRPDEERSESHNTLYVARPGETIKAPSFVRRAVRKLVQR